MGLGMPEHVAFETALYALTPATVRRAERLYQGKGWYRCNGAKLQMAIPQLYPAVRLLHKIPLVYGLKRAVVRKNWDVYRTLNSSNFRMFSLEFV